MSLALGLEPSVVPARLWFNPHLISIHNIWKACIERSFIHSTDQAGTFPGLDTAYAFQKSAENSNSISYPPSMYAQTLPTDASSSQRAHGSQQWSSGSLFSKGILLN